ncbi:hypothetical protein DBV15_08318 [Temnothorax longispinosus]|uniref:Uncharacterized protein n=1 Tax=Temnothorax longispinosus TaxID=300112 RepID=A0A4S2L460_9HYME|nr:hypothetical protein DBV15_08318 [Temnothorax longispinosus]
MEKLRTPLQVLSHEERSRKDRFAMGITYGTSYKMAEAIPHAYFQRTMESPFTSRNGRKM